MKIGSYEFKQGNSWAKVQTKDILSRLRKEITIHSIIESNSRDALYGNLEQMERQIELFNQGSAALSLYDGRYYKGTRREYHRLVEDDSLIASIRLLIQTEDIFERSDTVYETNKEISSSGETIEVENIGNTESPPIIILTAIGTIVEPSFTCGENTLLYSGTLVAGDVLNIDCDAKSAIINGTENVLFNTAGDFPLISPGENLFAYEDDNTSSHKALLLIKHQDYWC